MGQGYSTEALQYILASDFQELGLERTRATANIQNAASWRVMERAGMEREGFMRHHRCIVASGGARSSMASCGTRPDAKPRILSDSEADL